MRRTQEKRKCWWCGAEYFRLQNKPNQKLCSAACRIKANPRLSAQARGDAMRGRGAGKTYIKQGGRPQHRVVMEQKLGRALLPGEVVHHIDHNKRNNHPDNLMVMTQPEHMRYHRLAEPDRFCEVEGCENPHRCLGLCNSHYRKMRYETIYKPRRIQCQL